jgi:tetratricopeptide (TPR) repeat protein
MDHDGGLEDAAAALQLAPRHAHALTAKGMILRRQRNPEAALEALELAVALAPSRDEPNYRALFERAKTLQEISSEAAALAAWRELGAASAESTLDRCPPWMLREAEMAKALIYARSAAGSTEMSATGGHPIHPTNYEPTQQHDCLG